MEKKSFASAHGRGHGSVHGQGDHGSCGQFLFYSGLNLHDNDAKYYSNPPFKVFLLFLMNSKLTQAMLTHPIPAHWFVVGVNHKKISHHNQTGSALLTFDSRAIAMK